jgi:hypothetical protein
MRTPVSMMSASMLTNVIVGGDVVPNEVVGELEDRVAKVGLGRDVERDGHGTKSPRLFSPLSSLLCSPLPDFAWYDVHLLTRLPLLSAAASRKPDLIEQRIKPLVGMASPDHPLQTNGARML